MATEILMPRQGQSVESCLILEWKKKEGETVKTGDILCEVETDKATFEVEAEADGILLKVLYPQGADVPVLSPIAYIGAAGEKVPASVTAAAKEDTAAPKPETQGSSVPVSTASIGSSVSAQQTGEVRISPRARRLSEAKGLSLQGLSGSGPGGRIIERDVTAALSGKEPLTPAAVEEAIARELASPGSGSGAGGRITRSDLKHSVSAGQGKAGKIQAMMRPDSAREIPVKGIRKIIADRMSESLKKHAQLTLNSSADARALLSFRKKLKDSPESLGLQGITLGDFVLYAVSRTLPDFPDLNSSWMGDKIVRHDRVHIGLAVDTPKGLMVPVIRNADILSLKEISLEVKRLAKGCIEGGISPDELTGGTFTVTNLGALGIESFTPILNSPQAAILGICSIRPIPMLHGEDVKFIPSMGLSLTIDHQAVDGAPGARFLKALADALASFDIILAQ